jgi:TolB protein
LFEAHPYRVSIGNEPHRPPFYGHGNYINLTRHLISPFTTGYEGSAIESLYPTNTYMFRPARAQGALGGYVHPFTSDPVKMAPAQTRGYPVDLALEAFDYLEVLTGASHYNATSEVWHRSLNCGFRVTASAGEDSILSLHATPIVGANRLYAYLGDKLEWSRWVEAAKNGRTFVTNGPLLRFEVSGRIPGDEIRLPVSGRSLTVAASVESIVPVEKLELLFCPRRGLRSQEDSGDRQWLDDAARIKHEGRPSDRRRVCRCGNQSGLCVLRVETDSLKTNQHPGWRSEAEKNHVIGQFQEARRVFEARMK